MNGANRNAVLIGHSGFLGTALRAAIEARPGARVELARRNFVKQVLEGNGDQAVSSMLVPGVAQDWICAVGIVNPGADPAVIEAINVEFPRRLYALLGNLTLPGGVRLVTIGSVLESHGALASSNAYLASKSRMFEALSGAGDALRWHHIRLHTLYGGSKKPHPFMFAGQMFEALVRKERFKMSGGTQLREYHHVQDIAESVSSFLSSDGQDRIIELSSAEPIRLRELASAVFQYFNEIDLLEIGSKVHSHGEVFESIYQRSPYLAASRDPIEGVICWFKELNVVRS
ncbi:MULTISPECIES: NAD-dependent epimerase/dehydratase family protein [Bradyrhizobium]|uniref:Nucleoside-diphosphate-sugar epimerase n=1 Tax=Bradyrhizobium yuanmingense TaxID=108015 RepID=A0ABV4GPP8_9BRAD|nr:MULTISPECIES: NAD-dependent epimerase/dehydratase family protein [Bradyrhizobium]MCA1529359.1 NAD(P)-dependent oxidoreductase [Bradyrhizobium yuanmingense]MCA1550160.1 NAD(P)-dependent oxidoreductase [Bradyrhizobium sp. BRP19]